MIATVFIAAQMAAARPVTASSTVPSARTAIERALPALERSAKRFVSQRSCVSCHHNILPILTLRLASSRGFRIDAVALQEIERKTFRQLTAARAFDDAVQGLAVADPTPNDSWLLIAAHTAGLTPDLTTAVYAKRIASWRRDDHWTTSDFRPPHSSSVFTATATAIRAIDAYLPPRSSDTRAAVLNGARRWLAAAAATSTEDATFRLLGLVWSKAPQQDVVSAAADLRSRQRAGGGWPQLPAYSPDAYSTGEALYALHEAGFADADAWRRGIAFLRATQQADGTWHVRTRMISPAEVSPPYFTTGFPYKRDEYLSYAASCWATMALLTAVPARDSTPLLAAPVTSAVFPSSPLFDEALFGTAAQMAAHANVNWNVTTANGTSLLMAAADDPEKVKLLLMHGVDARYRAPSGHDAATVAASYGATAASIELLLNAGADAEPPSAAKAMRSPLLFASMSGDLETVRLLLERGASANPRPNPSGDSPLSEAVTFGHAAVVRALIRAGAKTDLVERTGVNLLHWATITNRADVIPELAKAGVDVNAIDEHGFTPLMYAATIDFGDTTTLRALLAAGADRRIRNAAGRTPLQQARRLGYEQIIKHLEVRSTN